MPLIQRLFFHSCHEAQEWDAGVEGVMRRCCEETMRVLRDNREALLILIEVLLSHAGNNQHYAAPESMLSLLDITPDACNMIERWAAPGTIVQAC